MIPLGFLLACSGISPSPQVTSEPELTVAESPSLDVAGVGPTSVEVNGALTRAAAWASSYQGDTRFDAVMMAWAIADVSEHPGWRDLDVRLRGELTDTDHEHTKLWMPDYQLPIEHVHRWTTPTDGSRINPNRVLTEALFCQDHGWRAQTTEYVCGAMRDDGRYHTTHGLWALVLANRRGCVDRACADSLVEELESHQPDDLAPATTLDVDLYAERLLTVTLAEPDKAVISAWAKTLIGAQNGDGSWGMNTPADTSYPKYHATSASAWALATWRQVQGG